MRQGEYLKSAKFIGDAAPHCQRHRRYQGMRFTIEIRSGVVGGFHTLCGSSSERERGNPEIEKEEEKERKKKKDPGGREEEGGGRGGEGEGGKEGGEGGGGERRRKKLGGKRKKNQ